MHSYQNRIRDFIYSEVKDQEIQFDRHNAHLVTNPKAIPRVIAVSGGKGGVGKTLFSANLGYSCAQMGRKVLLIDGDLGLANLDVVMNLRTRGSIDDVLAGECEIRNVIIPFSSNLDVLPASSGFLRVPELERVHKMVLLDQVESLERDYDLIIIDTAAGVSKNVQHWASSAGEVVIVVTPEPTSLADGYATMKILRDVGNETNYSLVINMGNTESEAMQIFDRFSTVADEFLGVRVSFLGWIPLDSSAKVSVLHRALLTKSFPFSKASVSISQIATQVCAKTDTSPAKGTIQFFWKKMVNYKSGEHAC